VAWVYQFNAIFNVPINILALFLVVFNNLLFSIKVNQCQLYVFMNKSSLAHRSKSSINGLCYSNPMTEPTFIPRKEPIYAQNGMVAASQKLAVQAGIEILKKGGNAADAAVATAAVLNVTEPTSTGLGGDCFALYYDTASRQVSALNGSGRAPIAFSLERLKKEGFEHELPPYHPYNVTVPGACAGWCDLVERLGTLPLGDILAPAIRLAEEGFPVAPITSYFWQRSATRQLASALNGAELTIDGRGPNAGETFRNPGLARTLQAIAKDGKKAFYQGEIAKSIVDTLAEAGGCMQLSDLESHVSTWEQPISVEYRGLKIWECPPNGQGLAALLALNLLQINDLGILPPLSPERLHFEIEALRIAFADVRQYVADPAFAPAPLEQLLGAGSIHSTHLKPITMGSRCNSAATRSISAWWTARATPARSSTATTWVSAQASSRAAGASRCRTAVPISAWIRRIPTGWSRASAPTTPSSPAWQHMLKTVHFTRPSG
jgi:gamma-glutamyltranspeptidase